MARATAVIGCDSFLPKFLPVHPSPVTLPSTTVAEATVCEVNTSNPNGNFSNTKKLRILSHMVLRKFFTDYFAKQHKSTDYYNEHTVCSLLK